MRYAGSSEHASVPNLTTTSYSSVRLRYRRDIHFAENRLEATNGLTRPRRWWKVTLSSLGRRKKRKNRKNMKKDLGNCVGFKVPVTSLICADTWY